MSPESRLIVSLKRCMTIMVPILLLAGLAACSDDNVAPLHPKKHHGRHNPTWFQPPPIEQAPP